MKLPGSRQRIVAGGGNVAGRIGAGRAAAHFFLVLVFVASASYGRSAPKRLSDWLLDRPPSAGDYPLGLSWRVRGEIPSQYAAYLDLIDRLSGSDSGLRADPAAVNRLREWLQSLPVTGRVPVASTDARWLEVNPMRDPALRPGDSIIVPKRPSTVTVLTDRGERCAVTHAQGREARDYLETCKSGDTRRADWAWIAQPDGHVQRFGIASWNRELQDEPAPGAWIWAPARDSGWPESISERLITFLASQGPAPDPAGGFGAPLLAPHAPSARSRSLETTASDWGGVGLLQTPSARMAPTGYLGVHVSRVFPYTRGNVFTQPFDWLEAGFRYTNISNRLYDPTGTIAGSQAYKDKSVDFKARLLAEIAYRPQLAVGMRDIAGTGLFSGEYIVGSKRTGPLDWSLGLGWGYLAGRGNLRNPLSVFGRSFDTRKMNGGGQGGNFSFGSYFHGPAALFGGVQYQTPWERLILKLEYDGNNYQHEPQANNQRQSSPWNVGLVYRMGRSADLSFGVERGNTAMLGLTLHTQLDQLSMPKFDDPPRVPVSGLRPRQAPDWSAVARELALQTDWRVGRMELSARELRVTFDDAEAGYWRERVDRAVAVLHRDAPVSADRFVLAYRQHGIQIAEHVVDRDAWVAEHTQFLPPRERREAIMAHAPGVAAGGTVVHDSPSPGFESGLGVGYQQTLGGPDGFVLFQLSAVEQAKLRLREDTWLQGRLQLGLIDNYGKFKYDAPSNLPRVRTFLREYLTTSRATMPNLELVHMGRLTDNQYYSVYGGYLESMFAGAGAEWLYRPYASRIAFGVDVNEVKQRGFRQDFSFLDPGYRVSTGHATLYWDTGWNNVQVNLSAGRYLAGDKGMTLEMYRVFSNGVRLGGYFSKTNVSSAQFGEGSFDKAMYVSIPFDAFLTRSSNSIGNFVWKPLTRDGGARLDRGISLYDVTTARDDRNLRFGPASPPNEVSIPANRREAWTPQPRGPEPFTQVLPRVMGVQWAADARYRERLVEALYRQGFRNIRVDFDASYRLNVAVAGDTLRPLSRAAGRAARTALRMAPLDAREVRIAIAERADVVVSYNFFDLVKLERFFEGVLARAELDAVVAVEFLDPSAREADPLAALGDLDTTLAEPSLAKVMLPDTRAAHRVITDITAAAAKAADTDWVRFGVLGTGLVLASSALDRRADRFARDHADNSAVKTVKNVGNALPWLSLAGAALAALDGSDPERSKSGYAAIEAGGAAYLMATALKYAVGRQRPGEDASTHSFKPFSSTANYNAFPSRHAIVSWAAVTPFAEQYDAPWLYGVAGITNLARVASREHWFSDTVVASVLGYGIGKLFYDASRAPAKAAPRVSLDRSGVRFAWDFE